MQYVFDEVNSLDKRCYEKFGLSEDLLMEHAALSIKEYIQKYCSLNPQRLLTNRVCRKTGRKSTHVKRL